MSWVGCHEGLWTFHLLGKTGKGLEWKRLQRRVRRKATYQLSGRGFPFPSGIAGGWELSNYKSRCVSCLLSCSLYSLLLSKLDPIWEKTTGCDAVFGLKSKSFIQASYFPMTQSGGGLSQLQPQFIFSLPGCMCMMEPGVSTEHPGIMIETLRVAKHLHNGHSIKNRLSL